MSLRIMILLSQVDTGIADTSLPCSHSVIHTDIHLALSPSTGNEMSLITADLLRARRFFVQSLSMHCLAVSLSDSMM